jgi:DNA-binding NarL/FixJ family response regulator
MISQDPHYAASSKRETTARLPDGAYEQELNQRELQVLRLLCDEYTSKQIASALGISFKTVACHRAHILVKVRARNTAGLVRYAIRRGIIDP